MERSKKNNDERKDFNYKEALKHFNGDEKLLLVVMKVFIDDMPKKYSTIHHALKINDFETVEKTAHAIKGGALYAGAQKAHSLALQLEKAARDKQSVLSKKLAENLLEAYKSYENETLELLASPKT